LEIQARAERKLRMLDASGKIDDLRIPPSNRLEALSGKRRGQWSVRINDRYRICFEWNADGAHNVEITDYH
jgi:proteic killer suppression protein